MDAKIKTTKKNIGNLVHTSADFIDNISETGYNLILSSLYSPVDYNIT